LTLGHWKVDEQSNEITAIPELLKLLGLNGYIVTIDAIGCQTEIAQLIVEQEADCLLALKGNKAPSLVRRIFNPSPSAPTAPWWWGF